MRPLRLALAPVVLLLLAGCAEPAEEPATGAYELPDDELGLILVDLGTRTHVVLSATAGLGWMSPNGDILVWEEPNYNILSNRTLRNVQTAAPVVWTRIDNDVTGLTLEAEVAHTRLLTDGTDIRQTAVPTGPRPDRSWSGASVDLQVLGAEWPGVAGAGQCNHPIVVLDQAANDRAEATGCHLKVARDGRVGWTEATGVRLRERDGELVNLTGTGREVDGAFVAHENPVFTANGTVYLRLTGGETLSRTEILHLTGSMRQTLDGTPEVLASLAGERRVALLDASDDGRVLLIRIFER